MHIKRTIPFFAHFFTGLNKPELSSIVDGTANLVNINTGLIEGNTLANTLTGGAGDDEPEHLPIEFQDETNQVETHDFILPSVGLKLDALEANLITQALDRTKGNRSKSARLLGITRDTLLYRMQKHGFFTSSN
jgi:DNA-binding NtrC family response regulator